MTSPKQVDMSRTRIVLFGTNLDKSCRQSRRGHPMRRDPSLQVFFTVKDPGKK
ncbi:MAG: hypothetical protein ACTSRU_00260 [Candidatus Hodarchaeales archaeon]